MMTTMHPAPLSNIIDLSGKTAIVTGGAMGIGFGIAYRLAEAGANVVVADLNEEVGTASAKQLRDSGWQAEFVKPDVADEKQVTDAVSFAEKTYGGGGILVNNE